ncbi:hypothetical protein P8452_66955 [Trifolium repens]|nr:hypothetical protein P8452_66955 [Trifolium repens]
MPEHHNTQIWPSAARQPSHHHHLQKTPAAPLLSQQTATKASKTETTTTAETKPQSRNRNTYATHHLQLMSVTITATKKNSGGQPPQSPYLQPNRSITSPQPPKPTQNHHSKFQIRRTIHHEHHQRPNLSPPSSNRRSNKFVGNPPENLHIRTRTILLCRSSEKNFTSKTTSSESTKTTKKITSMSVENHTISRRRTGLQVLLLIPSISSSSFCFIIFRNPRRTIFKIKSQS